jgi:hypothetical protein
MNRTFAKGLALSFSLAGCLSAGPQVEKPAADDTKQDPGKAEAWSSADAPTLFNTNLEFELAKLPDNGAAQNTPWASSYWPTWQDNINYPWEGAGTDSPAAKYGKAFNITGVADAVSRYHGIDANSGRKECTADSECSDLKDGSKCAKRVGQEKGRCIPTWWGICHAWAPAAILTAEPKYPVTINGVTLKVNDIKALVTLVHNSVNNKFVSLRCNADDNGEPDGVMYDEFGRPTGACKDTNAATYHILLANYLGIQKASFVEDRTFDDEVWNQPLRAYRVTQKKEVSATEANKLVGVTSIGGTTVDKNGQVVKDAWSHFGAFPVAAGDAVKVVMSGSGDADLYVKFGAEPSDTVYDCRPYAGSTAETCELTAPAGATQVFVSVKGYAADSTFALKITSGGRIPVEYHFNPDAKKFFHVKSEVDYIAESSSSTDGNLGSTIDRYTHTDHYEYILELDAAGKIIGGEWVGASKRNHPDFLWLPTSARTNLSIAGGKITYAKVKELLDRSMLPPGGDGGGGPGVDKVVNESGTLAKGAWKQLGPFNVGPGKTLTANLSGTGDADLYVRKAAAPTTEAWDCRPYKNGSTESCSVVGPGQVYVGVRGYATSSTFQLEVKYTEGGSATPPTDPPAPTGHLNEAGELTLGASKVYTLAVTAGQRVVIRTTAPNDVDLYIQMGQAPTTEAYLMRAWTSSGNETIDYTPTSTGTLYIMVHGYEASGYSLKTANQ